MTQKEAFDFKKLNHLDKNLRALVDQQYDFCLYKCTEKVSSNSMEVCKSNCVKNVIVPYRFMNHAAKGEEDNLYRKCLSEKFPNITADDYVECTNAI